MEPQADVLSSSGRSEKLEYGTAAKQDVRREQVNDFPHQEAAARDIGKDILVQQAGSRHADLGAGLP